MTIRFTLVTDGPSDQVLMWILYWLCGELFNEAVKGEWFDPRRFTPRVKTLRDRIESGINWYPCDLLFVHRDAEACDPQGRYNEIARAIAPLAEDGQSIPYVCVVPVRMTEAWLLFDEGAIRKAAGNPNGKLTLNLPAIERLETTPNPKNILIEALKAASELSARRLKGLNVPKCRLRVAELIRDYGSLRRLAAFQHLERDIRSFSKSRSMIHQ